MLFSSDENGSYRFKYKKYSLHMNKKMIAVVVIVVAAISIGVVAASKATMGDSATELPGEEGTEKALHIQESNNTSSGQASATAESGESGP
jgi:hypothetical protein